MKKILALLAVVLGVVSCQTEPEGLDVNVGGEQEVAICVTIPETETRAGGLNSALGVFDNGVLTTDATMRYILQVYYKTTENGEVKYTASKERLVKYSDGKSVTFPVRLVPKRDYQFVVWADVVDRENAGDKHYNTADLANVQLNRTWVAMDETRDAFTATQLVENYNSTSSINIILKRPFAKLRVVTTDMVALNNLGIQPKNATVTYSVDHYNAFNALAGNAIGDSKNRTIKHENFVIASYGENVDEGANMTLFTDYFFAEAGNVVKFELDVFDQNGVSIKKNNFNTDIAVQRNYLTTIQGNILTDGNNVTVTVEDTFANYAENGDLINPDYDYATISSEKEFMDAIKGTGGNYILISNLNLTGVYAQAAAATRNTTGPKTVNINLNGLTINVNNQTGNALVTLGSDDALIFSGEGSIVAENGSKKLVEGGNVYVTGTATVDAAAAEVKSGAETLKYVVNNGGEFTLTENIEVRESLNATTANDIVINGNDKTIKVKNVTGRFIDVKSDANGANLTLKNLTIENNVSWIERIVNYNTNGNLTLENVKIVNAEGCSNNYAINLPASSDNANVVITDSEIWAGAQALNLWGEKTVVNVTNSDLYVVDKNPIEGYSVVAINNDGETIADYSVLNFIGGSINVVYDGEGETKPSFAIRNNTAHSTINVSEETTVEGEISNPVAIIYWEGFNQYYSSQDLNAALDAAVPTYKATGVRMIKDLTLPLAKKAIYGTPVAVQMKNGGVFDGCNNTLSVENPEYNAYVVETYGGTIKNLNITTPAGRGIIISSPKEDIYIDNVFIDGPGYALNTTEHNGKNLVVTNSTLKGWTSFAGLESASFTSCTFGENTFAYWQKNGYDQDYDRLIRPYVTTMLASCVFEEGFYIDLSNLAAKAKVTLKDCVCGEVEITEENYSEYITIELPAGRTLADCVVFE